MPLFGGPSRTIGPLHLLVPSRHEWGKIEGRAQSYGQLYKKSPEEKKKKKKRVCVGVLLFTYSASSSRLRYTSSSFRAVSSDGKGLVDRQNTHTNMHTKSERGYKTVYYCTHRVTGRKITGQKLRVLSARLSLLAPALRQDVFDRGTHQSHTTLSKHINTALLTDKKHSIFPRSSFSGILGGEQPFFLFFFQMDGQVSFKSSQGVWAAFRDSRGQRRDL